MVVTALRDESVVDAARRMAEHDVGDLIVIDEPGNGVPHPVGIVTDRDLVLQVLTRTDRLPADTKISEVMRETMVTAHEDEDIESVLAKLRRHTIRRIPIIDQAGTLQGILSLDDVVGWMSDQLDVAVALLERQSGEGIHAS